MLIDDTFQSEEGIARELGSLDTRLSINVIRDKSPLVFFPPLNKSTDLPHSEQSANTRGHSDSAIHRERILPEDVIKPPSYSSSTTYCDHVARMLDVLLSAVECRVSRAPPIAHHRMVVSQQHCKTPAVLAEEAAEREMSQGCKTAESSAASCDGVMHGSARVAVLFSGGVDSAVLAALVDR